MSSSYLTNLSKQHNLRESIVNALKEFDVQSDDELSAVLSDAQAFAVLRTASLAQALLLQRHFVKSDKSDDNDKQQQQSAKSAKNEPSTVKSKATTTTTTTAHHQSSSKPTKSSKTTTTSSSTTTPAPKTSSNDPIGANLKCVTDRIQAFFQQDPPEIVPIASATVASTNKKHTASAAPVSSDQLSVVTWNVLSHVRTEAHSEATMRGERRRESMQQCHARHDAILQRLASLAPDVALLQDVDDDLIKSASFDAEFHFVRQDSCAVLLRRAAWRIDTASLAPAALSVAASPENGNGAAVVLVAESVAKPKTSVALVSLQCSSAGGDDERRGLLIEQVCNSLAVLPAECGAVVIGGDFGVASQRDELLERLYQQVQCAAVPFAKPSCTMLLNGAKFDKSLSVDRLAVRGATPTSELAIGRFPGKADGRGPYGDDIGDGSDHVWLACELKLVKKV